MTTKFYCAVFLSWMIWTGASGQAPFAWPNGMKAAVSLTFDDARGSQVEGGTALLDQYGVKATFFLVPAQAEKKLSGWKQAVANGHEIGNHSTNHPCTGNFEWSRHKALEEYTMTQMRKELTDASVKIEALLGVRPRVFAYPMWSEICGSGSEYAELCAPGGRNVCLGTWLDG